jgi:hypothetical protein
MSADITLHFLDERHRFAGVISAKPFGATGLFFLVNQFGKNSDHRGVQIIVGDMAHCAPATSLLAAEVFIFILDIIFTLECVFIGVSETVISDILPSYLTDSIAFLQITLREAW